MAWSKARKVTIFGSIAFLLVAVIIIVVFTIIHFNSKLCENKDELFYSQSDADTDTGKCYPKGLQGPCSENLVIMEEEPGKQLGQCSCPYMEHERALLYHKETNHCYFIFSQGYCDVGFWLNVTKFGEPVCEENKCLKEFEGDSDSQVDEIVPIKHGKCAILNQHAEGCEENQIVEFYRDHILPAFHEPQKKNKVNLGGILAVHPPYCVLGSYRTIMGRCQPEFEFDT